MPRLTIVSIDPRGPALGISAANANQVLGIVGRLPCEEVDNFEEMNDESFYFALRDRHPTVQMQPAVQPD